MTRANTILVAAMMALAGAALYMSGDDPIRVICSLFVWLGALGVAASLFMDGGKP